MKILESDLISVLGLLNCAFFSTLSTVLFTFAFKANKEKKVRAFKIATTIAILVALFVPFSFLLSQILVFYIAVAVLCVIILYFIPLGNTSFLKILESNERFDERDGMFSREEYANGTSKHVEYYKLRPQNLNIDEKIRRKPELLSEGTKYYDEVKSKYIASLFQIQHNNCYLQTQTTNSKKIDKTIEEFTSILKEKAIHLGAAEVGTTLINHRWVYSHRGRGPGIWGEEINLTHNYALVYSVEMDYFKVDEAPNICITEETALKYMDTQKISMALELFIKNMGYDAKAHIPGSNYEVILPAIAHDAGLGELGRLGYLISPQYGARIRLGVVTTELPLLQSEPIKFGVQEFCELCKKCANNCPSGAIPSNDKSIIRGVEKWQMNPEKCLLYWRHIGTDCGLCMKVCPFSHPKSIVHDLVRFGIKNSHIARKLSLKGEDIFYGKMQKIDKVNL